MDELNSVEVKQWLDKLIENRQQAIDLKYFSRSVSVCLTSHKTIQLYRGIEEIADAIGETLHCSIWENAEYPINKWFMYKGWCFDQCFKREGA